MGPIDPVGEQDPGWDEPWLECSAPQQCDCTNCRYNEWLRTWDEDDDEDDEPQSFEAREWKAALDEREEQRA